MGSRFMSGTTEVRNALASRLVAVSPGAAVPSASVAFENIAFTPTPGTRWYRTTFLPGMPVPYEMGAAPRGFHVGLFQVDIFDPPGQGDGVTQEEADRIAANFHSGLQLTNSGVVVQVTNAWAVRIPNQPDPEWYQMSVRIQWSADLATS